MSPSTSPHFLAARLIILYFAVHAYSQVQETPFTTDCYGDNFTTSSPYQSNLRQLIDNLIASTPNSPSFFSLINSSTSPQIFGLAQCRPDLTPSLCSTCLNNSASAAAQIPPTGCGLNKSGYLRFSNCLLRYSDQIFYNVLLAETIVYIDNTQNASATFNLQVKVLMKNVMASAAASELRFAVGVANDSEDVTTIYGMGWCSMDLSSINCAQCLDMVLLSVLHGKMGGTSATVSCMLRFETYQFYSSLMITPPEGGKRNKNKNLAIFAGASGAFALLIFVTFLVLLLRRRKSKLAASKISHAVDEEELQDVEIQNIDFYVIKKATNDFASKNKLGQGGFGPVYKGVLMNGQEIAVKRLSATSLQGLEEMKNEIHFVAKLQHKNLVRLLGYCLQGEEKLLVYEFLPNRSLDKFLFDPIRKMKLDWETRLKIIEGVGRGLLYLHEDSLLKIIHRDLKASNILLDSNMNPKISDFGLAKLFGIEETERNTSRIAGTFGYMAPEYVLHGLFSTKSDVFSYGVLLLEIITGEKTSVDGPGEPVDLLSYVWQCWRDGKSLQVIDKSLGDQYSTQEALRCVHIGLLCVQEEQARRPSMSLVTTMLSSSSTELPSPSMPAFYSENSISIIQNEVRAGDLNCLKEEQQT